MYAPHTVTLYNISHETDKATFEDVTRLYATILRGVFFEAAKAANVSKSGLEGADAVNLYIPFSVEAVDGETGKPKEYMPPQAYWASYDKTGAWTLSVKGNGGETVFVKGEYVTDNLMEVMAHDDCFSATKVDTKDFGSADMQHWEVGGA